MAKSLRSKWRRKCRAVKRIRYGQKELERLKKTLGIEDNPNAPIKDVDMSEITEIANVTDAKAISIAKTEATMETDDKKRVYNAKTFRDQNGAYPVWLHPRKKLTKRKMKSKSKKIGKNKK